MKGVKNLSLELEELEIQLENAIKDYNTDIDKILEISTAIDEQIMKEKGIKVNNNSTNPNYAEYMERDDKAQLMIQIRTDILNEYANISEKELEIISSNCYDFCCLMANGVKNDDIATYFLHKNNRYCEELTDEERECLLPSDAHKLERITPLTQKYINKMKKIQE